MFQLQPIIATRDAIPVPPSSPISLDDSLWPLLAVRMGRSCTDREFEDYLAARSAFLQRREPHLVLLDMREVHLPTTRQRQRYVEWVREHHLPLREWVLGTAYVLTSPVVRMMMSLVRHSGTVTTPYVAVPTAQAALTWATERLQDAGLASAAARVRRHHGLASSQAPACSPTLRVGERCSPPNPLGGLAPSGHE